MPTPSAVGISPKLIASVASESGEASCSATGHLLTARDQGTTRNAINVRTGPVL
jgi:hypothetical protein